MWAELLFCVFVYSEAKRYSLESSVMESIVSFILLDIYQVGLILATRVPNFLAKIFRIKNQKICWLFNRNFYR